MIGSGLAPVFPVTRCLWASRAATGSRPYPCGLLSGWWCCWGMGDAAQDALAMRERGIDLERLRQRVVGQDEGELPDIAHDEYGDRRMELVRRANELRGGRTRGGRRRLGGGFVMVLGIIMTLGFFSTAMMVMVEPPRFGFHQEFDEGMGMRVGRA